MNDFGVGGLERGIRPAERERFRRGCRAVLGAVRRWRVRMSMARGSGARWARARVDGVGESRVAFKPLVPLRGRPAGDVVGANEGVGGARRRWALVGSSLGCVLAGSVQRTGGLKATLHSSCRRRGGRAGWGGVRWWRVRMSAACGSSARWARATGCRSWRGSPERSREVGELVRGALECTAVVRPLTGC